MASSEWARFDSLPPELLLRILDHASPRTITRISQLNKRLHQIANTESVWKAVVGNITNRHSVDPGAFAEGSMSESWIEQARFVVPLARHLGYWTSSQPYSSRILRIRTDYRTPSRPGSPSLTPTTGICLHLIAEQLIPSNLLDSPSYTPSPPLPTLLPAYARPDPSHPRSGYTLPRFGPGSHSPDAGLQVDLLHEAFSWTPVFVATRERGARLPGDNASGPGSLRFRLERARREVGTREELEGESEGEEEGADRRSRTAAMLALFAGRPPRRAWPTVHLFGGEAVERPGAGTGAGAGSELRFRGALRGMHDYAADEESAVVQHVQLPAREPPSPSWPGSDFSDRGRYASHSDGFHIVAVRTVAHSADASRSSGGPGPSTSAEVDPATGTFLRRVGVGRDGGPAVLWHGQAQDPAERPRVAIVRAGGNGADGAGGLILHLQQPLPDDELVSEEVVRTEREDFFPLQPPAGPVTYDEPCTTDAAGEILASHLEGLWVGTYGPHGLEVGHLSVRMDQTGDVGPSGRPIVQRTLSLVKVTGDLNVGSGQISWSAVLDPFELTSPAVPSAGYVGSLEGADLGTVPSVSNETLLRWAASDPAVEGVEQPRWEAGSVPGAGQIALVGFVHRSWTGAIVTFIRSTKEVSRTARSAFEGAEPATETRAVDVVDEIRVRWKELGCVSVFKRVRI